jgi:hypothetical protein
MIDPKSLTIRELARRIQQTDDADEALVLSRELRLRAEAYARKRREEARHRAAARAQEHGKCCKNDG